MARRKHRGRAPAKRRKAASASQADDAGPAGIRGRGGVGAARRAVEGACALVEEASRVAVADTFPDDDAIHALRVLCKRLRAFWQLLTPALGRDRTRPPERALRDAARRLAGPREARVAERTIARLACRRARDDSERAALAVLRELSDGPPGAPAVPPPEGATGGALGTIFAAQRTDLAALPAELSAADLRTGLLRSYRRARTLGRDALRRDDPRAWHRCRRWAKYELYQLELLAADLPDRRRRTRLKRLGETLGHFNDLQDLRRRAAACRELLSARGADRALARVLAREERRLRGRMERRFTKLYGASEGERARVLRRGLRR